MPPTPCPERLSKLIDRLNRESGDEAHVLRKILAAIQNKRQNNKGPETYVVNLDSKITISLTDYSFHIRNELADALADIDPPNMIERVRECPVCGDLFWAGREDKKACDKHVGRWRKRHNRRDIKQREKEVAATRKQEEIRKALSEMSRTAIAIIRVIMGADRSRLFGHIDFDASYELVESGEKIRSTKVMRQTINKLAKDGYLEFSESAERGNDRYDPTQKLRDLWAEMTREPATH